MLTYMDETEIKISHIDNIKLIHFYTLDDITNNVMGLAVFYGDKETLNLCAYDSHFELLISKTLEYYSALTDEEKNLIFTDEATRKILDDSSSQVSLNKIKDYSDKVKQNGKTEFAYLPPKAYFDFFLTPVITYTLESIMSVLSVEYERLPYKEGWFGKGMYKYRVKGIETIMPYIFQKLLPGYYKATVNNFIEDKNLLTINAKYGSDSIILSFFDQRMGVEGSFTFALSDSFDKLVTKHTIIQNKKELYYNFDEFLPSESNECKALIEKENLSDLVPETFSDIKTLNLPWNQSIIIKSQKQYENGSDFDENQISYFTYDSKKLAILNFFENRTVLKTDTDKKINSSKMLFQIYKDISKDQIQLAFESAGYNSSGYYKDNLQNSVFQFDQKGE